MNEIKDKAQLQPNYSVLQTFYIEIKTNPNESLRMFIGKLNL